MPVCSLGVVVRSVIIQCAVELVPHLRGEDQFGLRSIPVKPSDLIVLEPVQDGLQFVVKLPVFPSLSASNVLSMEFTGTNAIAMIMCVCSAKSDSVLYRWSSCSSVSSSCCVPNERDSRTAAHLEMLPVLLGKLQSRSRWRLHEAAK